MDSRQQKVLSGLKTIFLRQVGIALIFGFLAAYWQPQQMWSWLVGCCAGLLDNFFVLRGIAKGMKKRPDAAARGMHLTMFTRMASLAAIAIIMLKLGQSALGIFLGAIVLYVTMLVNMLAFSYSGKSGASTRKGDD